MTEKTKVFIFFIVYTFFCVLLFVSTSYGVAEVRNRLLDEKRICVSDDWKYEAFRSGKDISVKDFVERYPMESQQVYTMKGMLPDNLTGAEALYFYSQNLEVTVRVDNRVIYKLEAVNNRGVTGAVENIVPLPHNAAGKEVTIIYHSDGFYRYKAIDAVYLGEESEFVKSVFLKQLPLLVLSFLCFSIALIQLVISIVIRGENTYQMHYLGWATLVYSLWIFGASRVVDFFSGYRLSGQNIRYFALAMLAYPLLKYVYLRFRIKQGFLDKCLKVITFFNFLIVLALYCAGIYLERSVFVTYSILIATLIRILYVQIGECKQSRKGKGEKPIYGILNFIGIGLMTAGLLVDIVRYMFSLGDGWLYFSPIGFLVMICVLSFRSVEGALDMMRLGKCSENVKQLAYFDILTQVYNRTALNEDMEKYEKSKKERKNFGIVVFDVNNLKWVNDNLGHLAGDKLLQDSAEVIRDGFEGYGKTYRFGGDEFVVVMEEGAKEKYAYGIQQMEKLLAKHNEKCKRDEKISIAYGVAYYDGSDEQTLWQVQESADGQMYERKRKMKSKMIDGKDVRKD